MSLACMVKGRSSSAALNASLRKSLPDHLGFNIRPALGFIKTHLNPADDPTRLKPLRAPCEDEPSWFTELLGGHFEACDSYLAKVGMHLEQLRELPPVEELYPDAPLREPDRFRASASKLRLPAERLASRLLGSQVVSGGDVLKLFRLLPAQRAPRSKPTASAKSFFTGLFVHGGVLGLRSSSSEYPAATRLLCRAVTEACPGLKFSTVGVLRNMRADAHVDAHNSDTEPNFIWGISRFKGGGLWIAAPEGQTAKQVNGKLLKGEVLDIRAHPALFNPHIVHATEAWEGVRVVLVAFTIRGIEKLSPELRQGAESLGFPLPDPVLPSPRPGALACGRMTAAGVDPSRSEPQPCGPHQTAQVTLSPNPDPKSRASRDAEQAGVEPSYKGRDLLRRIPPGQFVHSEVFPSLQAALDSGPGWVDLFSGSRGLPRALVEAAPWWVVCYDWKHDGREDLLNPEVQAEVLELLQSGAVLGFSAGPPSGSFSAAISPPWRTREQPEGVPWLTLEQQRRATVGNLTLEFCQEMVRVAKAHGLNYLLENPASSWFWKQPSWREDGSQPRDFNADMCRFGCPWRKSTRFRTGGQLAGQELLCSCVSAHVQLRGRCRKRKVLWTKLAEPYPRRLCSLLAAAIVQDVGLCGEYRRLDIARCAKAGSYRIGEAGNPGPRAPPVRRPATLGSVALVEPRTVAVREKHWAAFLSYLSSELGADGVRSVLAVPSLLVGLLCSYAQVMYDSGTPLHYYRQLLAHAQKVCPGSRPVMKPAWDFVSRWERLEPLQHRPPMPEILLRAMSAVALSWGWRRWSAITLLCFYAIARIGETLAASRNELLTPKDALEDDGKLYLIFRSPKTRNKGARVQHAVVDAPPEVEQFLLSVYQDLPRDLQLFGGSASVYRRRWDMVLQQLGIPNTLRLTPGSLRGGGAVRAHKRGLPISEMQWRMRLSSQSTLGYYLQETTVASILPSLTNDSRSSVLAAEACLPFLLKGAP